MKENMIGILSGILLVCVLVGNTIFSAFAETDVAQAAAQIEQQVSLPVLMYHHILKDSGRWGDYVISPTQFENDLKQIQKDGYTTVTTKQIEDFLTNGDPLPSKPILITFDDGYESFHEYAFPLLKRYQMNAVVSIIGKYTDLYSGDVVKNVSYSHVNWDQLREMLESGFVEVGNHTYEQHQTKGRKGIKKLDSETDEQYRQFLLHDVGTFNQEIKQELGVTPTVFAYPFGAYSKDSREILSEIGFHIVLTCEEKVNFLNRAQYQPGELIALKRYNRPSGISSEKMFEKFNK